MSTRFTSLRIALGDAGFSAGIADYVESFPSRSDYVVCSQPDGQHTVYEIGPDGPLDLLEGRHFALGTSAAVLVLDPPRVARSADFGQSNRGERLVVGLTAGDSTAAAFRWPEGGVVEHLGASTGLLPDTLARALSAPTPAPSFDTNRFWTAVWLAELLRRDDSLEPIEVAALHPGVLEAELGDMSDLVDLYQFVAQRHRDHLVVGDWAALRDDAECGRFPFYWLSSAALAWWHDEGSFARSVEAEMWDATESMLTDPRLPHTKIRAAIARLAGLVG